MTAPRGPRGPYRKSIERRERILDAALDAFAEHGDRGASLQEIADRVGVTQSTLLYYFSSREELLLAVLARRDTLGAELASEAGELGDAVVGSARRGMSEPGLVKLFVALSAAATDPAHGAHAFFAERYRRVSAQIAYGLEAGQDAGRVRRDESAQEMADLLVAALDGLQVQWLMDPSFDMSTAVRTFMRVVASDAVTSGDGEEPVSPTREESSE